MIKNIITWQCQFLTIFDKRKTASLRTIFRNCKIKWLMQCVITLLIRIFRDLSDSEIRFSKKNFYHRLFWKNIFFYSGFCLVSIITSRYFRKSKKSLYKTAYITQLYMWNTPKAKKIAIVYLIRFKNHVFWNLCTFLCNFAQ